MKQAQIVVNQNRKSNVMPLNKFNYRLLFVALGVITLGFILMIGGNSGDPNVFDPAIFGFQRITLAPIVLLLGYTLAGISILVNTQKR